CDVHGSAAFFVSGTPLRCGAALLPSAADPVCHGWSRRAEPPPTAGAPPLPVRAWPLPAASVGSVPELAPPAADWPAAPGPPQQSSSFIHLTGAAQQFVNFLLPVLLLLAQLTVAHGFVTAGVGFQLGAINGYVTQLHSPCPLTQSQRLHKQS